jgi:uncharacterized protein (TIGR02001 family)|tara:strand:+ start:111 stop:728 length:618 start_codon:yes stop_codon:yes gene_type:complete
MKNILMIILLLGSFPTITQASSMSYNVGYMSDYWYRGVFQSESAVSFGADAEVGNFYVGTWMADVDTGIEMDVYGGYGFTILGMDSYIGATGYYYSDNFDSDYEEINTGLSYGNVSYDYSVGKYKTTTEQDYSWSEVTMSFTDNLSVSYGEWGKDLKGSVTKVNFNKTIHDIDFGVEVGKNDSDTTGAAKYVDTTYATFSLGISF